MTDRLPNPTGDDRDLAIELRLLLAFLLMGVVLFLTPYFYRTTAPPRNRPPAAQPPKLTTQAQPSEVEKARSSGSELAGVQAPVVGDAERTYIVETDLFRVRFSNRGAVVTSWVLKRYRDTQGQSLELVNQAAAAKVPFPFSIQPVDEKIQPTWNQALFVAEQKPGPAIEFRYVEGPVSVRKLFQFRPGDYRFRFVSEVYYDGKLLPHLIVWRGGFGDFTFPSAQANQHSLFYDLSANKLVVHKASDAKKGPLSFQGSYSFAGIEDRYFAAVALPDQPGFLVRVYSDPIHVAAENKEQPHVGVGLGGAGRLQWPVFVGPKDLDLLRQLDPKLTQIVDFGWFSFLAKPLFYALKWVNERWVHNYGWSIVLVTIAINFLLFPLKLSSLKSMRKMQALQPEIQAINEKYRGMSLRDPRRSRQNEELMELYRKHGVNPMGGCLPMLLQIPFFIAFYKVLTVAIELRGAEWLWVKDLSQPEHLPIRILPIVMVISQFVIQKMTPATTANPAQQRMMLMMPLIMGFIFYGVSSGLVLYWLTSNLVGIVQQLFIDKVLPAPKLATPITETRPAAPRKRRARK